MILVFISLGTKNDQPIYPLKLHLLLPFSDCCKLPQKIRKKQYFILIIFVKKLCHLSFMSQYNMATSFILSPKVCKIRPLITQIITIIKLKHDHERIFSALNAPNTHIIRIDSLIAFPICFLSQIVMNACVQCILSVYESPKEMKGVGRRSEPNVLQDVRNNSVLSVQTEMPLLLLIAGDD